MPGQLGPGKGKDFDGSNAMGPCLVTADELTDPYGLAMVVRVNGEEWGRGHSSEMKWTFADCIAHVSRSETLYPGEFFGSGTVGKRLRPGTHAFPVGGRRRRARGREDRRPAQSRAAPRSLNAASRRHGVSP